jgi:uncharacterized protein YprB with RNaseH-like and TPR domain
LKTRLKYFTLAVTGTRDVLTSTFVLLKGIGERSERRLWETGVTDWAAFLDRSSLSGVSPARKQLYDTELHTARRSLDRRDSRYFATALKQRHHWRLYDTFRHNAVYLDIETTGERGGLETLTVVGLYGRGAVTQLVAGESLTEARLADELNQYELIVTFFGSAFDLPMLRAAYPRLSFHQPHVDLCFTAKRLGLRGGLKSIETTLGIDRPSGLAGLNGWDAVQLWRQWCHGDTCARERLLAYNAADVVNLQALAEHVCETLQRHCVPAPPCQPPPA